MNPDTMKLVLRSMIVSKKILGRMVSKVSLDLLEDAYAKKIAKWCYDYFETYGDAPGQHILDYLAKDLDPDKDEYPIVHSIIESVANAEIPENEDFLLEMFSEAFSKIQISQAITKSKTLLNQKCGQDKALQILSSLRPFELSSSEETKVTSISFNEAFDPSVYDSLLEIPGAYGEMIAPLFYRESFVAIQAPEKTHKTWFLIDLVARALESGNTVAFFEIGDMSKNQVMNRLARRLTGRPASPVFNVSMPQAITPCFTANGPSANVQRANKSFKPLDHTNANEAIESVHLKFPKFSLDNLRIHVTPNNSTRIIDIRGKLDEYISDGFIPDFVVLDYADLLVLDSRLEKREGINLAWMQMRALSQEYKVAFVTATQAKASAYEGNLPTKDDFSEDKRKLSHATAFIGLSKSPADDRQGLTKVSVIESRTPAPRATECVLCAMALDIGKPVVLSMHMDTMEFKENIRKKRKGKEEDEE